MIELVSGDAIASFVMGVMGVMGAIALAHLRHEWHERRFRERNLRECARIPGAKARVDAVLRNMDVLVGHLAEEVERADKHPPDIARSLCDRYRSSMVVPVVHHLCPTDDSREAPTENPRNSSWNNLFLWVLETCRRKSPQTPVTPSYVQGKRTIVLVLGEGVRNYEAALVDEDGFESVSSLTYVLLHLATLMARERYGHDASFWDDFRYLLGRAVQAGVIEADCLQHVC